MRKVAVITWLLVLLTTIVALFWHNEWVYRLPTPVPNNYRRVEPGTAINENNKLPFTTNKPVFLHFFNPDCPCSRFNIPHFKSLVKTYSHQITFAIVPVTRKRITANEILKKFGFAIPVLFDSTLAATCGVYSTPQAVVLDTNRQLYFRGNYNRSRYCTDKKTEYARMAIDKLLHNNAAIIFDQFALKAYGCQLPKCSK
ncbi:AhpC/TSA family protein [Niastella caeni]|uniref:AhpC/TSA family protein n=1 Tax=Niastella caeni TaxID=2569763 RepID=A0A4V4H1N9_9BACT|nr:AhpC/TSA family protein [Niastella caeni]THU41276.1 AhpC/TSA family protein [Niastella caeni]